jgi:hypothetical protein
MVQNKTKKTTTKLNQLKLFTFKRNVLTTSTDLQTELTAEAHLPEG